MLGGPRHLRARKARGPGRLPPGQNASGQGGRVGVWSLPRAGCRRGRQPGTSMPRRLKSLIWEKPLNPKSSSLPAVTKLK